MCLWVGLHESSLPDLFPRRRQRWMAVPCNSENWSQEPTSSSSCGRRQWVVRVGFKSGTQGSYYFWVSSWWLAEERRRLVSGSPIFICLYLDGQSALLAWLAWLIKRGPIPLNSCGRERTIVQGGGGVGGSSTSTVSGPCHPKRQTGQIRDYDDAAFLNSSLLGWV